MDMPTSSQTTTGEAAMPAEVRLRILDIGIGFDKTSLTSLMRTSKTWYTLIRTYECTLSRSFTHAFSPSSKAIRVSSPDESRFSVQPYTFGWVRELYFRNDMLVQLLNAPVISIQRSPEWLFASQPMCEVCLETRFRPIREKGLRSMLSLSDAKASAWGRGGQEQGSWVTAGKKEELAFTWIVSHIASLGYNYPAALFHGRTQDCTINHVSNPVPEDDRFERELQCVYHEMALRHGPFFIWASTFGSEADQQWVFDCIEQGLKELKMFERGGCHQEQSLQSMIRNAILDKTNGQNDSFWFCVKELVCDAMMMSNH